MYRKKVSYKFITDFPPYRNSGLIWVLRGKVLVAGGAYRGGFCKKRREASPMSDKSQCQPALR